MSLRARFVDAITYAVLATAAICACTIIIGVTVALWRLIL